MEKYEQLTCEVVVFDTEDVITGSRGKQGDTINYPLSNNIGNSGIVPNDFGG